MDDAESVGVEPIISKGLIGIHKVITRGFSVSNDNIQIFIQHDPSDAETFGGFLDYLQSLTTLVHAHHSTEDEVVFPIFKRELMVAPYDLLKKGHVKMEGLLDQINPIIRNPDLHNEDTASMLKLQDLVQSLSDLWAPHIEIEECRFSQNTIAEYLNTEEQRKLSLKIGEQMQKNSDPVYMIIPFIYYNLSGRARDLMAPFLPPNTNFLLNSWKDHWMPMKPFFLD